MFVQRLREGARLPTQAHPSDAGWDFYTPESVGLRRGETTKVPLGVAVAVPEGHVMVFLGRSSLAAKGVVVLGGVIDAGYRGELTALLQYSGPADYLLFAAGDRVIQGVVLPVPRLSVEEVLSLPGADRSEGSSGR